jgi:DNA-binding protein HU-beta
MSKPSARNVIRAFADIVREHLENGQDVHVPGLGTFVVEHQPSMMREQEGNSFIEPPRDVITFTPES